MNNRAYLMCHHPEMLLAEQILIKSALSKNYPTLETLSLTKLLPNSEKVNGSITRVEMGQQPVCIYKKKKIGDCLFIALNFFFTFHNRGCPQIEGVVHS